MPTVTPATARLLADAGFPQPAPAPGQWWYNKYEDLICWGHTVDSWGEPYEDATTFAPTVGDILRELPDYHIVFSDLYPPCGFTCFDKFDTAHNIIVTHDNEHEAAALAWLYLHEK